jgi:hypothetical protein
MEAKENAADPTAFFENFLGDLENAFFKIVLLAKCMSNELS